jgi:hypothetical protein
MVKVTKMNVAVLTMNLLMGIKYRHTKILKILKTGTFIVTT